jgi:serine phosphatase RsbU (regulator of sigma subunit)
VTVIEDVSDVKRAEFAQRILGRTGELLAHGIDYRKTLEDVAELLVPEFADWCAVNTIQRDGTIALVANSHRDPERLKILRELRRRYTLTVDSPGIVPEVVRTQRPLLRQLSPSTLSEVASNNEHLELLRELDAASTVVVPMIVAGRTVGALNFVNDTGSRRFGAADVEIASEVARRSGVAIENARIADERARLADVLQRELLPPRLPTIDGWQIEAMYEPAGELNEVGGDFYEAFRVLDGWAIVLGDVSGHGAAAASLTAEARHTIRSAGQVASDPCAGLHMLNRNLHDREDAALCSAVMLVLSDPGPEGSEVTVYLAGHPHPLILRGQEVDELGSPGPALGVVESPIWEPVRTMIRPGDQLILYTDGVTEARRSREEERFGSARLREHVAGSVRPEETIARVRAALEGYRPEQPDDDAALIAIRRAESEIAAASSLSGTGAAADPATPLG